MNLHEQLIRDEGLRLKPYRDTVGKLTIGVGRNLDDVGITQSEAAILLQNDISACDISLRTALPWVVEMDEIRYAALLNAAFNLGVHGLLGFRKALNLAQQKKYSESAQEFLNSTWTEQIGDRAHRIAKQLSEGIWV